MAVSSIFYLQMKDSYDNHWLTDKINTEIVILTIFTRSIMVQPMSYQYLTSR